MPCLHSGNSGAPRTTNGEIFQERYPIAISLLEGMGRVCDDSLADDVSLGSDSQSLVSSLIFALNLKYPHNQRRRVILFRVLSAQ